MVLRFGNFEMLSILGESGERNGAHLRRFSESRLYFSIGCRQVISGTDQLLTVAEHFKPVFEKTVKVARGETAINFFSWML